MLSKVLIVTAVEAEKEAVLRGLSGDSRFEVLVGGVGPVAAAVSTATKLAWASIADSRAVTPRYDLVVSAGIGGGFEEQAAIGSIVIANEVISADLGAETPEGFASVDKLGFGSSRLQVDLELSSRLAEAILAGGHSVCVGPILTLSTVTGTALTASELAERIPGAAAEAMEGYGVAAAAHNSGIPFIEIRTISNKVGPRDRAAWRIGDALAALEIASTRLSEVI
ncbi:futalosine hydrolase [Cohnella abietis]|uniref:Futalosine hydrolase n=1 Tax=Cohnella abietis TaxID=2507935 RepID=A0A3T1DBA8_9BACL|nr:futalosine hydrolase [Cohnella abietis]BBI35383.1 Futalosine hydrolase [Cohnella abietis]